MSAGEDATEHDIVVVVVVAGIAGINTAYRLQTQLPDRNFLVLEARDNSGGTWDGSSTRMSAHTHLLTTSILRGIHDSTYFLVQGTRSCHICTEAHPPTAWTIISSSGAP